MQTNANADNRAVATALSGVTVRGEQNMLSDTALPGLAGARAALETFYYAFNTRSLDLYLQTWADDPLIQLDTPVAGLVRGTYLHESEHEAQSDLPEISTTCICIFRFNAEQGGWRQVYHHVALDDADQLARFQRAVRGT